jgi:hypothetical protein
MSGRPAATETRMLSVQQEIDAQRERDVEQQFAGGRPGAV